MEPRWLPLEAVLAMHERQLAEHGGGEGVRDQGLLESALQRPINKLAYSQPDLFDLAAAYAYGIATNHPFVDGHKRTALVASFAFLRINKQATSSDQAENVRTFLALAAGELSEAELASWFRLNATQP